MDHAELFHLHPHINPITGRSISENGMRYKQLVKKYGAPGNTANLQMFSKYKDLREQALKIEHPPYSRLSWLISRLQGFRNYYMQSFKELMGEYYYAYMALDQLGVTPQHDIINLHRSEDNIYYSCETNWLHEIGILRKYVRDVETMTTLIKAKIILVEKAIQNRRDDIA